MAKKAVTSALLLQKAVKAKKGDKDAQDALVSQVALLAAAQAARMVLPRLGAAAGPLGFAVTLLLFSPKLRSKLTRSAKKAYDEAKPHLPAAISAVDNALEGYLQTKNRK